MAAADSLLVPLQCEFFALEGLSQLLDTVEQVRGSVNQNLSIQGIVMTMYDGRNNLSVKLLGNPTNECSVVWGVRSDPVAHLRAYRAAMMAREPLDLSTSTFQPSGTLDGVTYFNTRSAAN